MKRVILGISSTVQFCLWGNFAARSTFPEEMPTIVAMMVASMVTLLLSLFLDLPKWSGVVGGLLHTIATACYLLPGFILGGEYAEGVGMAIAYGLIVLILGPPILNTGSCALISVQRF